MNRDRFINILRNPDLLDEKTDLPLVKEMVEAYPYFSIPYLLQTKMLYDDKSIYFDKNLKLTATVIGNREVLYNYLHRKRKVIEEKGVEKESALNVPRNPSEVIINSSKLDVSEDTDVGSVAREQSKPESGTNKSVLEILPPSASDYFAVYGSEKNKREEKILSKEAEPSETFQAVEKKETLRQARGDIKINSFSDWLAALSKEKEIQKNPEKRRTSSKDVNEIIADFIGKEPKIKKRQARFYSPETMAQQSAEEPHNVATETLANIYIKQGLKDKAIEIFQQLSLRFPEKSAYFAEKIKGLKEN
jgi:hypothetical protein